MQVPIDHPRKESLDLRHKIVEGMKHGIVAEAGLIAHGRGEAYDYLLGEKTCEPADEAERVTAAALLCAKNPVISINGNTAVLCPKELVELAKLSHSKLEINLFYRSKERIIKIHELLKKNGAEKVYGLDFDEVTIPELSSERAKSEAIADADTVWVMLEDGDRTEKLVKMGKKVIAVDLNPLSRTAKKAQISIVDNVVRAIPNIIKYVRELKTLDKKGLNSMIDLFDNEINLKKMEESIRFNLD